MLLGCCLHHRLIKAVQRGRRAAAAAVTAQGVDAAARVVAQSDKRLLTPIKQQSRYEPSQLRGLRHNGPQRRLTA